MRRLLSVVLLGLAAASMCAAVPPAAAPEVAIIHYDKLKDAKLEGTAMDIVFTPVFESERDTPCLQLTNMRLAPRKITLQLKGLTESEYDLYMDTNPDGKRRLTTVFAVFGLPPPDPNYHDYFIGTRTKAELEAGIPIGFPGTSISAVDREYYNRVKARAEEGAAKYKTGQSFDQKTCFSALGALATWFEDAYNSDLDVRSVRVLIAPKGKTVQTPPATMQIPSAPGDQPVYTMGQNVQVLRRNMVDVLTDPICKNDCLQIMSPVDMKILASAPSFAPGKRVIKVSLQNWTDRPVSGSVKLIVPQGWKVKAVTGTVKMPSYGATALARFEVTVPKAGKPEEKLSSIAVLSVEGVEVRYLAEVKKQ